MAQRIFMISSIPFWPLDDGNRVRIFNLINNLKECCYEIDYLYYNEDSQNTEKMREIIGRDHFIYVKKQEKSWCEKYRDLTWRIARIPKTKIESYALTDGFYTKELERETKKILGEKRYDIIWLEYYFYSKVLNVAGNQYIKVIDTHDIFAYRDKKSPKNMRTKFNASLTYLGERKALKRADIVLAIQEQEEKYFIRLLKGTKTEVLTIGDFRCRSSAPDILVHNHDYCFVGSANEINVLSVKWFMKEVYPQIHKQLPDARMLLVGDICQKIDYSDKIIKMGKVEDIAQLYRKVRVVINPSLMGTGINIKATEAVSYKKPIVTTVCGSRGFFADIKLFEIADKPEEFARKVVELLTDDQKCERLIQNCKVFEEKYKNDNLSRMKMIGRSVHSDRKG